MFTCCTLHESVINLTYSEQLQFSHIFYIAIFEFNQKNYLQVKFVQKTVIKGLLIRSNFVVRFCL
jgi:hypothetical protein